MTYLRTASVVAFDLDDTLFPESQFVWGGLRAVSCLLSDRGVTDCFLTTAWELYRSGSRGLLINETLSRLGIPLGSGTLMSELIDCYRYHTPTIQLHDDARVLLNSLAENQVPLALVTNGGARIQEGKMRALGIIESFRVAIFCQDRGEEWLKPSLLPFRQVMEVLSGYQPTSYVYIGDHPTKDFAGARACGWRTIRVHREGTMYGSPERMGDSDADVVIRSFYELQVPRHHEGAVRIAASEV
jgi:putative hydrolase of the HAD superfamily